MRHTQVDRKIWKPELDMRLKIVQFLAVVLTALALVPGGANTCAPPGTRASAVSTTARN